jgi:hypothetical protein
VIITSLSSVPIVERSNLGKRETTIHDGGQDAGFTVMPNAHRAPPASDNSKHVNVAGIACRFAQRASSLQYGVRGGWTDYERELGICG